MSLLQKLLQGPVFKYLIKELVDLEYLVTWVLGLGFHGLGVGPNDVAGLVRPLHPIAEVPLRLLRQELLQLLLVRLPIDLKLLFKIVQKKKQGRKAETELCCMGPVRPKI